MGGTMSAYLDDMALFVEVVKARSFKRAAAALGMPNSSLSRRISGLEKRIGLQLLVRTTRNVEPTAAGLLYYERCRRLVEEARVAHEQLGDLVTVPSGVLRMSLPVDFAIGWVAPLLPEFARMYPDVKFDIDLTARSVDLVTEPFDVALRMTSPKRGSLVSRVLDRFTTRLYASPEYARRIRGLKHVSQIDPLDCLTMPADPAWRLRNGKESVTLKGSPRFRANSIGLLRGLAVSGMGVVFLPERLAAAELSSGRLVRIFAPWEGEPMALNAVTSTHMVPARAQKFIEFLAGKLQES
jgi:DNA-binding transcriptional LysR family regulator